MKKMLCFMMLFACLPFAAFAEPGWSSVKEILRKEFPDKVNAPASDIIKIEDAKDGSYWKDKEQFPPAQMFSYSGWVYYKGELPGEVRRQRIIANFELIAGQWQYKFCGVPMSGGNDQVTAATKRPPLPVPPAIDAVKKQYIDYLKEKYSSGGDKLVDLSLTRFDAPSKLTHVPNEDGSYSSVTFGADAKIEFVAKVRNGARYQKITGSGPAKLSAQAAKEPASEWFKSVEVKKWNIAVFEDPIEFKHDYEDIEETDSPLPSVPAASKLKGLKGLFD